MGRENMDTTKKTAKFQYNQVKLKRFLFVASFLALPIIGFLVFYLYVNFDSIMMAFKKPVYTGGKIVEKWSFDTWKMLFTDESVTGELLLGLRNTLLFYFSNLLIVFPVSLFMAYFFFKEIKGYRIFRFIFYLPCIISSSVLVILFKYAVGDGGILQWWCNLTGKEYVYPLTSEPNALMSILFYSISFGFGGKLIVLSGSMNGLNREVMEAGAIDGCNWFQEFTLLVIPMMWPTLSTMIILDAAGILGVSGPILAFSKGAFGTTALSFILYDLVAGLNHSQNLNYAAALGFMMTLVTFPIVLLIAKFTTRGEDA